MALNFPDSPVAGTVFGAWRYDGVKWGAVSGVSGGGSAGDITAVLAGTGLSGGGTEGDVSIALTVPVTVARGGTGATDAATALTNLGGAPLSSPIFTGDPQAPTPAPADNDTSIATTAFVTAAIAADITPWSEITGKPATFPPTLPIAQSGITNLTTDLAATQNNVGRNLIHNSLFNIAQRGTGPFTTSGTWSADRWQISALGGDTISTTVVALTDADRTAIGDEAAISGLQSVFVGTATSTSRTFIPQAIENVRRLAGKTVTVSFWAKATSGTPRIGICLFQSFGSGGSPSAGVSTTFGATTALSPTWTRYTFTGALPTASGKTLGTNADNRTSLQLYLSCASANPEFVNSGSIGQQSGTVQFWGVQLEIGSTMTPLEKPDPRYDLANCQRFYQQTYLSAVAYQVSGQLFQQTAHFQPMRAFPTVTLFNDTSTGLGARSTSTGGAGAIAPVFVLVWGSASATGTVTLSTGINLSADL